VRLVVVLLLELAEHVVLAPETEHVVLAGDEVGVVDFVEHVWVGQAPA
jgi:hypothetical protein